MLSERREMAAPKLTRTQRKQGAELRETRRTAERLRRQRATYRKRNKPGVFERLCRVIHSWHVALRVTLLMVVVVLGTAAFATTLAHERQHDERDRLLVQSVPAQAALWAGTRTRSFTAYVDIDGRRVDLDRDPPMFSDERVGETIMVVVDPKDPNHVIAANFDESHAPGDPLEYFIFVLGVACVIAFSLVGAYLVAFLFLYPELKALLDRLRKPR